MKVWKCELCDEEFESEEEAREHANTEHNRPAREIISIDRRI